VSQVMEPEFLKPSPLPDTLPNGVKPVSALLLKGCQKKQESYTAIFNKFSMEAANIAFKAFISRPPLSVT